MPIPFILGALAVAAGVGGVGAGIKGAIDIGLPSSLFYSFFLYSRKEYFPIEL